jgi:predicted NBD/HSP70 family sugar kinase
LVEVADAAAEEEVAADAVAAAVVVAAAAVVALAAVLPPPTVAVAAGMEGPWPRVHINDKLHTSAETSTLDGERCLRVETRKKSEDAASVPRSKKSSRPEAELSALCRSRMTTDLTELGV